MAAECVVRRVGEGERIPGPYGRSVVVKAAAAETRGAFTFLEFEAPPANAWPAAHVHATDEAWYVLEGELSFRIGEQTFVGGPGAFVLVPGGVPHANTNLGGAPTRYLVVLSPAGLEGWLRELAALGPDEVGSAAFEELATRYGVRFLPPRASKEA